jgi:hypothetical protein
MVSFLKRRHTNKKNLGWYADLNFRFIEILENTETQMNYFKTSANTITLDYPQYSEVMRGLRRVVDSYCETRFPVDHFFATVKE